MHFLYIDTTDKLILGLLDETFQWVSYQKFNDVKPSEALHLEVKNLMEKYKLNLMLDIHIINAAGPGSYTGMRLTEGFVQVLSLEKIPMSSFYHFEVPMLYSVNSGIFISNAFKNQFFQYTWDLSHKDPGTGILIDKNNMNFSKSVYTLGEDQNFSQTTSTIDLLKNFPDIILKKIVQRNIELPSYYYRALEDEFKVLC